MVTLSPLRIYEDCLNILGVVLKSHLLNLLDFDNFLKAIVLF
jgi:hypothetical protein